MSHILGRPITADTTRRTADATDSPPRVAMVARLRALLPTWFADDGKILDALLSGIAFHLIFVRAFIAYSKLQTRVATATGAFLDLAAFDFFRNRISRRRDEADGTYSKRIRREVLRPRATRDAIIQAVTDLTGTAPDVFEPFNPGDCGGYGVGTLAYGGVVVSVPTLGGYASPLGGYGGGAICYGTPSGGGVTGGGSGRYGSLSLPNQIFLTVHRPAGAFPNLGLCGGYGTGFLAYSGGMDGAPAPAGLRDGHSGYGVGAASYGLPPPPYGHITGAGSYLSAPDLVSISDAEIYSTIADVTAAGVVAWTCIQGS